jgi:hypothetical protein
MGLDSVEFVLGVEEAFQVAIPDADAERMLTPGDVVDYLSARLGAPSSRVCLEQRAFYRLRRAAIRVFGVERAVVLPATRWDQLLPAGDRKHHWLLMHQATGTPQWPSLTFWRHRFPTNIDTVGGTAAHLAEFAAGALRGDEGLTREQIETTVKALMREHLGIEKFEWSDQFVRDLHVD